jgi:molecular chaperone GrpE
LKLFCFVTIWHFARIGSKFAGASAQMKIKNILKNFAGMNTENTDRNQELEDAIQDGGTNAEQQAEPQVEEQSPEEKLGAELEKEKDKFLRLFAEFENFKRRTAKERLELFKTANQEVLQAMLPIMDDFERAMAEIKKSEDEVMLKGVELIYEKLKTTLASKGLEVIDTRAGDTFNADIAEAITQIPAPSDKLKGKIVDVLEKGYKLGDKIIRFPKVVIGQ